jgi:hypothetical protein
MQESKKPVKLEEEPSNKGLLQRGIDGAKYVGQKGLDMGK